MESRHYFRVRDQVRHLDGSVGMVVERFSLYATVQWSDGRRQEVDQFDPLVVVVERAESE
jgi:hypothetical protein